MIVKRLLAGLETADSANRARGAAALARAYLLEELSDDEAMDAETGLTALLDDPVIAVRKAMARVLATTPNAPPHIIAALATDHSLVASRVLTHSPLLAEDDLIDALGVADATAQVAIALRPYLSGKVAAMIAEQGGREAMIALAVNETAVLSETSMQRMIERHGEDGEVREALLGRSHLPAAIRASIAGRTAEALHAFVIRTGWLNPQRSERCTREAHDTAVIEIAAQERGTNATVPLHLAARLRDSSQLTPSLLLRTLVSGERGLLEASLAVLSGTDPRRVAGLVRAWSGAGFAALYTKAGLPPRLLAAFRAALEAQDATGLVNEAGQSPRLSSLLIERTLQACEASGSPELRKVNALLHRLRAEAIRSEARAMSLQMIAAAKSERDKERGNTIANSPKSAPQIDLKGIEAELDLECTVLAA